MNLATNLVRTAASSPDRSALRQDGSALTYSELDDASARVAGLLRAKGVRPGDRVGLMMPNVPYFAIAYYGILRAGGIVVPMNVLLKGRETAFYLQDSQARTVFAWHEFAAAARQGAEVAGSETIEVAPGGFEDTLAGAEPATQVVEAADDDTAVILYTSGTTGKPKGAELTHGGLSRNAEVCGRTLFHLGTEDVVLGALPLFHAFGQTCALNASVAFGSMLSLLPRFDAGKALDVIERDRVTIFMGVPTMYSALLHHPAAADTSSLRLCVSGGAALPVEVLRSFEKTFGCMILEGYGLSETSPVASFNHPDSERKPGSIGTPIEGVEMRLLDDSDGAAGNAGNAGNAGGDGGDGVGEIAIRGHNVMKGYWQRPDATAEVLQDGWFRTGDVARRDDQGYYYIVDRKKDLIIRGGYNVYPREIEEVLYEHPAVAEAAVIGLPDESLGEEVGAAIALKPGTSATPEELRDHVKKQVAGYKYPRKVWLVDALPKGPTGKILKREIAPPDAAAGRPGQDGTP